MSRNGPSRIATVLALATLTMSCAVACTSDATEPVPSARTVMTPDPCIGTGSPVPFDERHPDEELAGWWEIAQGAVAPATCVHQADAVDLIAIRVSDVTNDARVSFAVDVDAGHLYDDIDVLGFSREDPFQPEGTLLKPDATLSADAVVRLREALDRYRVLEWPFRDPGEPVIDGEYTVHDGFEVAVVFSDDTGTYAERPGKSDSDMIGFLHFAQKFLAEHIDEDVS